jgi:hypothetical protein
MRDETVSHHKPYICNLINSEATLTAFGPQPKQLVTKTTPKEAG